MIFPLLYVFGRDSVHLDSKTAEGPPRLDWRVESGGEIFDANNQRKFPFSVARRLLSGNHCQASHVAKRQRWPRASRAY